MDRWIEAADWIVWQLCGEETRNVCTAGYKGIHQDEGYPSRRVPARRSTPASPTSSATKLEHSAVAARRARRRADRARPPAGPALPEGIAVAVGNVDAHVTAPPPAAIEPGQMLAVMGTSTCHVMNGDHLAEVPGMCGVVDGRDRARAVRATRPGRAASATSSPGSSSTACRRRYHDAARERGLDLHEHLSELAAAQRVGEHGLVALDWHSGNRSVLVDHELSGVIVGLTLATRPEDVYRALLEATAFGTRTIIEAFEAAGRAGARSCRRRRAAQEPVPDADLRRRARGAAEPDRVRAGPGARRGHARRGGRGLLPDIRAARGGDGQASAAPPTRPTPARAAAYDALYARVRDAARLLRPRRQRGHAPAAAAIRREGASDERDVAAAAGARSARCTPSSSRNDLVALDERQHLGARARRGPAW